MNKTKRTAFVTTCVMSVGTILAGCAGGGEKGAATPPPAEANKPVTITVFNPSNYSDYLWNNLWVEPIKKKYPHITLVNVKNEKGSSLAELVTANRVPDIIQGSGVKSTFEYNDLGIVDDMTPLMKANGFDIGGIDPISIDNLKIDKKDSKLYGLPVGQGHAALYYNKDLFEKFGVPYPKDGMTWDELGENIRSNHFTLLNLPKRLAFLDHDPWEGIASLKQTLPGATANAPSKAELAAYWKKVGKQALPHLARRPLRHL